MLEAVVRMTPRNPDFKPVISETVNGRQPQLYTNSYFLLEYMHDTLAVKLDRVIFPYTSLNRTWLAWLCD